MARFKMMSRSPRQSTLRVINLDLLRINSQGPKLPSQADQGTFGFEPLFIRTRKLQVIQMRMTIPHRVAYPWSGHTSLESLQYSFTPELLNLHKALFCFWTLKLLLFCLYPFGSGASFWCLDSYYFLIIRPNQVAKHDERKHGRSAHCRQVQTLPAAILPTFGLSQSYTFQTDT